MNLKSLNRRNLTFLTRKMVDRVRGLDFLGIVESHEVGLDPRLSHHYSPSGSPQLARILRDMAIGPQDSIIDIGCGKGSAMRTMLRFPFAKVDGLELSPQTARIAVRNFERLKAKRVNIHVGDATRFAGYGDYSIFYFYNPFPAVVMQPVVEKLVELTLKSEKEIVIIYNNPTCGDLFDHSGVFSRICVYPDEWRNGIFIFSNRKISESRLRLG